MCECISQPRWIPVKRPMVNLASLSFWPLRSFLVGDIFMTSRMKNMWCLLSGWCLASALRLSCYWYFGVSVHREWTPAAYPGGAHLSPAPKVLSILHSWPVEISINVSTSEVSSDTIAFKMLRRNTLKIWIVLIAGTLTSLFSGWSSLQVWRWRYVHQSWILLLNRLFENSLWSVNTDLLWHVSQSTAKTCQSEIPRYALNTLIHTHTLFQGTVLREPRWWDKEMLWFTLSLCLSLHPHNCTSISDLVTLLSWTPASKPAFAFVFSQGKFWKCSFCFCL